MFEIQDKYVDNLGRILTIDSIAHGSFVVNLEGEIKNFISEDALKNYLTNNNFDKINLTPADHIQEFEQETQHLINTEDTIMKTESFLKKLDRILENDNNYSKLKRTLKLKEGHTTSNVQINYYGVLLGDPESATKNTSNFKSIRKVSRFYEDRPYLFSITDQSRNLVRFVILAEGLSPYMKILPFSTSKVLQGKLKPYLILNLAEDHLTKVKSSLIAGSMFRVSLLNKEEPRLSITFKTEDTALRDGSLAGLIQRLRTKGQPSAVDVYESKRKRFYEEDEIESEDFEDEEELEDEVDLDTIEDDKETMDMDDLSMEVEKRLGRNKRRFSEEGEEDLEDEDLEDDIDTDDEFNDEEETGDEEEITADEIEEPEEDEEIDEPINAVESISKLRNSLRKYIKVNESEINRYIKKKQYSSLYRTVAEDYSEYRKNTVLKEFKKLMSSKLNESISLSFDKAIKSIHTSVVDGKSIVEVEFEEGEVATIPTDAAEDATAESPEADETETPEADTPTEEAPKTEESYKRRVERFLNQKI